MKIIIDTHNCSREELEELKEYLNKESWDFKTDEKKEEKVLYILSENAINDIELNEKIRDNDLFEYYIIDRKEFIDELINWISEAEGTNKIMMKADLEMLMNIEDEYMLSSISTNEYIGKADSNFNELCKELLDLNKSLVKK